MNTWFNLNQTVLRVAVNNVFPFCCYKTLAADEIQIEPSIEFNYLKLLSQKFNFQTKFVDMKQRYGIKTNGTWDGVVNVVNRSLVDLGMCDLSVTWERTEAVDFSHTTIVEDMSILFFAPQPKHYPWIVFVPFTLFVWICICVSILILSSIHSYNRLNKFITLVDIILKHFAIILRQPINCTCGYSKTSIILFILWMFLGLIFSTCYVSVFFSTLTIIEHDQLNSIEDLLDAIINDRMIVRFLDKTHFAELIQKSKKNESILFYEIKKNLQRNKYTNLKTMGQRMFELLRWKSKIKPAFFSSKYILQALITITKGHRKLSILDQSLMFSNLAFALPKGVK